MAGLLEVRPVLLRRQKDFFAQTEATFMTNRYIEMTANHPPALVYRLILSFQASKLNRKNVIPITQVVRIV